MAFPGNPPMIGANDPAFWLDTFARLPPRTTQLLWALYVEGQPEAKVAESYGVPLEAFRVNVRRANALLQEALRNPGRVVLTSTAEEDPPDLAGLRAIAPQVRSLAQERAKAEATSPAQRRRDILR